MSLDRLPSSCCPPLVDSYQDLCCELLHALEAAPCEYRAQWAKLIARTRARMWSDVLTLARPKDFDDEPLNLE